MQNTDYRKKTDLCGTYLYRIPGGEYSERTVPGSYHCVGDSEYKKEFLFSKEKNKRVFLNIEGINYEGTIHLNNEMIGKVLPYCHYSFDITDIIKDKNTLTIYIKDINAPYGPVDGWCCYSGIIRAIYIETVPKVFIEDAWFRCDVASDLLSAKANVSVALNGNSDNCSLVGELFLNENLIASTTGESDLNFYVENPLLWSPDDPVLYQLRITLYKNENIVDIYESNVGFKKLTMDSKQFYLNEKPIFFTGVCRHDLLSDEKGQTLSNEDIENDLKLIKKLGANFVRLVHYPHDKRVIEAADRIGLLVSEESGLWWSDMSNKTLTDGAIEVLKKTIIRDRSNVSVAFWMGFNECIFTQEFLCDSVKVCREYDPDRFVSGANCMNPETTKEMFDIAGIDFYTFHPYGTDINSVTSGTNSQKNRSSNLNEIFNSFIGKPLIFTEWGGWNVVDNPALFLRFCNAMKLAYSQGKLAGMIYWAFADMYEFNRGNGACIDGVQIEGLVTIDRQPKINYYKYRDFINEFSHPFKLTNNMIITDSIIKTDYPSMKESIPIKISEVDDATQINAWNYANEKAKIMGGRFKMRQKRTISIGPVLPQAIETISKIKFNSLQKPLIINKYSTNINITTDLCGKRLWILGNVLYYSGIPTGGVYGEICAVLNLYYTDNSITKIPLRNGIELLTVMTTFGASIIDPSSPKLSPAVTFSYDKNFENYRIYMLPIDLDTNKKLVQIEISISDLDSSLLIYGLSIECE